MLITKDGDKIILHNETSFNTIASKKTFCVAIDSSFEDAKRFSAQFTHNIKYMHGDRFFTVFDSIVARVKIEIFIKNICNDKKCTAFSNGGFYRIS